MISRTDSKRIGCTRFPLIIGVLYIHAYEIHSSAQKTPALDLIRELISQELARTAVPIFFLVSGFLFFNGQALTLRTYLRKLLLRTHSLFIPLIIWNTIALGIFAIAQSLPFLQTFFSGQNTLITNYTWFDFIAAIFGIGRHPIAYQFWFIRDLILLAIFSPVVAYLLRKTPWLLLLPLTIFWFLDVGVSWTPSPEALLFFSSGAMLSMRQKSLFPNNSLGNAALISYPLFAVIGALKVITVNEMILHHATVVVGVLALLYSTQFISRLPSLEALLLRLSGASFFVFAAHEPLLTIFRKLGVRLFQDHGEAALIGLYLILPLGLTWLLVIIYNTLSTTAPTVLAIISGRSANRKQE